MKKSDYNVLMKRIVKLLTEKSDLLEENRRLMQDNASLMQENIALHEHVDDLSGALDKASKKDTAGTASKENYLSESYHKGEKNA